MLCLYTITRSVIIFTIILLSFHSKFTRANDFIINTSNETLTINSSLSASNESFNVGLLMVKRYLKDAVRFDLVHIGPAIDIAKEKCLNYYDINLNILPGRYEGICKEREAIGRAYDLLERYKGNLIGFIGPACSNDLQAVSQLAAYKKIPILTGLGDIIPSHRSDLTSLIRLSYDMRDKARAILAFLGYFNWKTFGLVYRYGDVYYNNLADVLIKLLKWPKYSDFKCYCRETYFRDFDKVIITDIDKVLQRMTTCSRIIIILGGDKDVRTILLKAHEHGMTQGQYVFIYPELIEAEALGNMSWSRGVEDESIANQLKVAYQSLLIVSLNQPPGDHYKNFSDEVKSRAERDYGYQYNEQVVNYFTASFHDAVLLLCRAIRETLHDDQDPHDGVLLVQRMRNLTLNGVSGDITIDEEGDRIADYALLDQTNIDDGLFEVVLRYYGATKSFTKEKEIIWPPGKYGIKPRDIPECGFKGDGCDKDVPYWNILLTTLLIIIALILTISIFIYHKVKLEAALANMSWKVRWEDIILDHGPRQSFMSKITSSSQGDLSEIHCREGKIICAHYKGNRVAIKKLPSQKIELTREILMELKILQSDPSKRESLELEIRSYELKLLRDLLMRETSHENLARFIGACVDVPNVILTEYCPKGSLRDLLMNFSLNLDWMFRFSLINDIIAGMCYLHSSEHIYHGRLKSTNCLVDSRFCIKLSDFGLEKLRSAAATASATAINSSADNQQHQQLSKTSSRTLTAPNSEPHLTISVQTSNLISNGSSDLYSILYLSPDFLSNDLSKINHIDTFGNTVIEIERNKSRCRCTEVSKYKLRRCYDCVYRGQKADVYSYSIILQEIITRSLPFHPYVLCMDIKTIANNIVRHDLRPDVPLDLCENKELYHHMVRCWSREPHSRPDFNHIKREIRMIARSCGQHDDSSENTTLTEKLLQRMEQYANELESIVEQRTGELAEEKKKTEELLYQILPRVVANQLKIGESVVPDYYDSVTVYFSDIVGFTAMCSESSPIEVVNFLNDLYTCFDSIISDYDVYKVETIGDAYMVVSGLPERNGHEHVRQIARMSLRMVESVDGFVIRHRKDDKLKLRIGIHSGPCCAGVVGNKRPRYCLFGDTINTASRMESTGETLKIHISSATKVLLDKFNQFVVQERGDVIIKGKGIMKTYWLLREETIHT